MPTHLWLVGMMGAGKTTVGRTLALRLSVPFVDTDEMVVRSAGSPVPELWAAQGEEGFRRRETAAITEAAQRTDPTVIAVGGGAVTAVDNISLMRRHGTVVWLTATVPTLAARVGVDPNRPLLGATSSGDVADLNRRLAGILAHRTLRYEAAAHHTIDTETVGFDGAVDELETLWRSM